MTARRLLLVGGGGGGFTLPYIDPADYGALSAPGSPVDDTLALQAAIDAAALVCGTVRLGAWTYLISAETSGQRYGLTLPSCARLAGAGMHSSTLEFDPGQTPPSGNVFHPIEIGTPSAGASNVVIRDLEVIGNHSALNAGGTKFIQAIFARHSTTPAAHSDDILIERVRIYDFNAGIGCLKDGTSGKNRTAVRHQRWIIRDCEAELGLNKAYELDEAEDSQITNCTTINCVDGAQVINFTARSSITGCTLSYKDGGINVTHGVSDITVSDNVCTAIAGGGGGFNGGIVIRQEAYAEAGPTSSDVLISGNTITDHASTEKIGIRFASYTMNTGVGTFEDYTISGNTFDTPISYLYDTEFPAKTRATGLIVTGNTFTGDVETSGAWASDDTRFEYNHVEGDMAHDANNWDFLDNTIDGSFVDTGTGNTYGSPPPATCPVSLQAAINAMSPGGTLDVTGCTFTESVTISTDNITIIGGTIDGQNLRTRWADVSGDDVTLDGMTMIRAAPGSYQEAGLQVSGTGFTGIDLTLTGGPYACARLWVTAVDATLTNCDMSYGPAVGLLGYQADRAEVSGGRYHHNLHPLDVGNESGGMKFGLSGDLNIHDLEADHNVGPGVWLDVQCDGSVVDTVHAHHNTRSGIHVEITDGCDVTGCTVNRNCSENGRNRFEENGIFVSSSRNVSVAGNTVAWNNPSSPAAPAPLDIGFVSQNRAPLPHDGNVGTGNILRSAVTAIAYDDDWAGTGHSETLTPNTLVDDDDPLIAGL